jgi:hypothetical protein
LVVLLDDAAPLGLVVVLDDPEPVADGEVADGDLALLPVDPLTEPEPVVVVVLLLPGVVLVPGDADGGVVRSGVLPTRSVSVRLQATLAPASSATAQKPESIFFIADAPPCGVSNHEGGLQRTCPQRLA